MNKIQRHPWGCLYLEITTFIKVVFFYFGTGANARDGFHREGAVCEFVAENDVIDLHLGGASFSETGDTICGIGRYEYFVVGKPVMEKSRDLDKRADAGLFFETNHARRHNAFEAGGGDIIKEINVEVFIHELNDVVFELVIVITVQLVGDVNNVGFVGMCLDYLNGGFVFEILWGGAEKSYHFRSLSPA